MNNKKWSSIVMRNWPKEIRPKRKTSTRYNQRQKTMEKLVQIFMQWKFPKCSDDKIFL